MNRPHIHTAPAGTPPPTAAAEPPWQLLGPVAELPLIPRAEWPAELLAITAGTGHMVTADQWRTWHHIPPGWPLWYVPPRPALPLGNTAMIDALLNLAANDPDPDAVRTVAWLASIRNVPEPERTHRYRAVTERIVDLINHFAAAVAAAIGPGPLADFQTHMDDLERRREEIEQLMHADQLAARYHRGITTERQPDGRNRYTRRVELTPPAPEFAAVYHRRGMPVPAACSGLTPAALWPYMPRAMHRVFAYANGYFWLPCPLCGREFGGHEITDTVHMPEDEPGMSTSICPVCTAERNGGTP